MFGFLTRNKLAKWLKARQDAIRLEFEEREKETIASFSAKQKTIEDEIKKQNDTLSHRLELLKKEQRDLADLEKRVSDKKIDLEKSNDELRQQIRLIEAKSSPDSIWTQAFSQGFSKAWDMMIPTMISGVEKLKERIRNQEIDASLSNVKQLVDQRISDLQSLELKTLDEIQAKRQEFLSKLNSSKDVIDQQKYDNFIKTLDWVIQRKNGN